MIGHLLERQSKRLSRKNLYSFVGSQLAGIPDGARILNVGSGGAIAEVVEEVSRRKQATVVSVDISAARKPDIVADICETSFKEEYEAIVMAEVLEHVSRPHLAIERVFDALAPGGLLILTVPFIFPLHDRPHDYYRYTKYGLAFLLSRFATVEIRERNGWAECVSVLLVRILRERKRRHRLARTAVAMLALAFSPLAVLFSRLIELDFITTGYVVSARKN